MKRRLRVPALVLILALLFTAVGAPARAEDAPESVPEERPAVNFLSYEEAVRYFDFDRAASNWCAKFGMDPATQLEDAKKAILAGTDPKLIIGLATFSRATAGNGWWSPRLSGPPVIRRPWAYMTPISTPAPTGTP